MFRSRCLFASAFGVTFSHVVVYASHPKCNEFIVSHVIRWVMVFQVDDFTRDRCNEKNA